MELKFDNKEGGEMVQNVQEVFPFIYSKYAEKMFHIHSQFLNHRTFNIVILPNPSTNICDASTVGFEV